MGGKVELPFGVKVVNPKPLDYYYDNEGTPYVDVDAANLAILSAIRYYGLTCNINNTEYWYKNGLTDNDLIVKPSDLFHEHDQQVPSALWEIEHGLGKYPSITVINSVNREVIGDIDYVDANNLTITFTASFSGKAYMN